MQNRSATPDRRTSVIGRGTEKLYYEDAYRKEFEASVLSCECLSDREQPRFAVILDRTAFFPEEGGQSPDRGYFALPHIHAAHRTEVAAQSVQVLDVQIRDGVITHVTDAPLEPGTRVRGVLDFSHRFSNMQQHSAEHLFSGLVWSRLGLDNVGFHLSDKEVTMDYSGTITPEDAAELEREVNRLIWKNIESRQEYPTEEELKTCTYRSKVAIDGQIRLVVFPGCDICACCAPHVARTGEIGLFRILSLQSHRGGVRIHMLAGERAFRYLARENAVLAEAARALSTSSDQVPVRIEKLREALSDARRKLSESNLRLLLHEADSIPAEKPHVCLFTQDLEEPVLREAVNRLMEKHAGMCAVFNGSDTDGYRYVIGSTADVLTFHRKMTDTLQARGGGKPPMIQGRVQASRSAIESLFS